MQGLLKIAHGLDRLARTIGSAASWLILPLIMIIMFDVITRKIDIIKGWSADITIKYGFSPSFIFQDLEWHIHGALMLLTFGFGYLLNAHVRVDIFREMASRRGQVRIELWGLIICAIPFLLMMMYWSWEMAAASYSQGEGSESQVGIGQRWIIKSFLFIGFAVALAAVLATLFRCIAYLRGTPEESAEAEEAIQFLTDDDELSKLILEQHNKSASEKES